MNQDETLTKKPSVELPPSESWVIVKSETDTPADDPAVVKASEGVPSHREDRPFQHTSVDTTSQAPAAKQAWSGSGREQSSTSPTRASPVTLSGGSGLSSGGGDGEVITESIKVEDVEEKEDKTDRVVDGVSHLVLSVGNEEEEDKFSTPSAASPQVSE